MKDKHIIAGSGGFIHEDFKIKIGPMLKYAFKVAAKDTPKFAYIGTATGDDQKNIASFYDACSRENISASHLELFPLPNHRDIEKYILSQDVIWVGGGSVANLLAVWRAHGLDAILQKAWTAGVILTGQSAGSICWNIGGTTDSFGVELKPITNGLGFLPYSSGVHYDSEARRRPLFEKLIEEEVLPEGYATDDGVNLHFINTTLHKAISDTEAKKAYHVYKDDNGELREDTIQPEFLN